MATLQIDGNWIPTQLRGNTLYWKNIKTQDTRTSFISQGRVKSTKKELAKFKSLSKGLGYPWVPDRYEAPYIIYKSSVSGLETESYVPSEWQHLVPLFLKVSGAPSRARIITLDKTGKRTYEYIDRGDFDLLRDTMTVRDKAIAGFGNNPYSTRTGIITKVIDGHTVEIDGSVVVSMIGVQTPSYRADPEGFKHARDFTERFLLGKEVSVKVYDNTPRDSNGNVAGKVYIKRAEISTEFMDVGGEIMYQGHAPIDSSEPKSDKEMGFWDYLDYAEFAAIAETTNFVNLMRTGEWGNASISDKLMAGQIFRRAYEEKLAFGRKRMREEWGTGGEILDVAGATLLELGGNITGDPTLLLGKIKMLKNALSTKYLKPFHTKSVDLLDRFPDTHQVGKESAYQRYHRALRQVATLPNPLYHSLNLIGDTYNAAVHGMTDLRWIGRAGYLLTKKGQEVGERIVFTTEKGRNIKVRELLKFQEMYDFKRFGTAGQTLAESGKKVDWLDRGMAPMQAWAEFQNGAVRYAYFLYRLYKGDKSGIAFEKATQRLINYDKKSLTNFERTYLDVNIPFYMFMRQNTVLHLTNFANNPLPYRLTKEFFRQAGPTEEELSRMPEYMQDKYLIRNPLNPKTFFELRLPLEFMNALNSDKHPAIKALSLLYPEVSMVAELAVNRNLFDNTRPSDDYSTYIAKKFSMGWYYIYRQSVTLPPVEFVSKRLGFGTIEPYEDISISSLYEQAGITPSYEMIQEMNTQDKIAYKTELRENTAALITEQRKESRWGRDRAEDWGVVSRMFSPIIAPAYLIGALARNYKIERQKGTLTENWRDLALDSYKGMLMMSLKANPMPFSFNIPTPDFLKTSEKYFSWEDKLAVSETTTALMGAKNLLGETSLTARPFEHRDSDWYWRSYGDDQGFWEGGFWDRFVSDVATDPISYVSGGVSMFAKKLSWGAGRKLFLNSKGLAVYEKIVQQYGKFEGKHQMIALARANPGLYTDLGGIKILYKTIIPSEKIITLIAPVANKLKFTTKYTQRFKDVLKNRLSKDTPVTATTFNHIIQDMKNEIRTEMQLRKADIWILNKEAKAEWGEDAASIVRELIENPKLRRFYPQVEGVVESIIARNHNIAMIEQAFGLLDNIRSNYLLHTTTPEVKELIKAGKKVKFPKSEIVKTTDQTLIEYMGEIINPYNHERMYDGTITKLNDWSITKNGHVLFEENWAKIQSIREEMHVTSINVLKLLRDLKNTYGNPLGKKLDGFVESKIPQLQGQQYPRGIIQLIENNPLIMDNVPELAQKSKIEKLVGKYDMAQMVWKLGVTFTDLGWLPTNTATGIFFQTAWLGRVFRPSAYTQSWTEMLRNSDKLRKILHMSDEGGVVKLAGEKEPVAVKQIVEEMRDAGIFDVEGDLGLTFHTGAYLTESLPSKVVKAIGWAAKNSESFVRAPLYWDLRVNRGLSMQEAKHIVEHYHGNYAKESMSWIDAQVMTRATNFYVWYKLVPTVAITEAVHTPSSLTTLMHLRNAWNGPEAKVDEMYMTDRQRSRFSFVIQAGEYLNLAPFSMMSAMQKWAWMLDRTESGFWWGELKQDPDLLKRFLKGNTGVNWLDRGAGRVEINGDEATITYVETQDSLTVSVDRQSGLLTVTDDQEGDVIKQFPINLDNNRVGIYQTRSTTDIAMRLAGEMASRVLMIPIELATNTDFRFNSPIDERWEWLSNQFVGEKSTLGRGIAEILDPTIPWQLKAIGALGNYIDYISKNRLIPRGASEELVKEAVKVKIWEIERGDFYGCGF